MDIDTHGGDGTVSAVAAAGSVTGDSAGELSTRELLDDQMGNANGADWQEEVYQKIKSMKEMYLSELNDLYQKIASKVQQHDSLPQRPQNEQIEKLKMFKMTLERIVLFLQLNKHDIQLTHKEKLLSVERHISFFLSSNRPRKPSSSPLQGQLPQSSMQLQQPQSLDDQTNPSMQPVQGSMSAIQENNLNNLQHNSLSGVPTISNSQQHMINTVQPGSSVDLGQSNSLNSLQQVATGSLQQNPVNSPQQVNISSLSSQSGTNPVQENLGSLQQNSNALQVLQNQQLTQQCNQLLMQQQIFQRQQLMQQHQTMNSLQQLMQQNNLTILQHNSLSGLSTISNSQQHMINTVQPCSSLDMGQGNSLNPLQQVATGSLQQNPVNSPQVNISSLSSQSGTNPVQENLGSLQKNSSVLLQMLQTEQLRQQYHQQQLFQSQQLMQLQQAVQQQTALLPNPQMSQLHQMRQQMGMKTGVLQQQLLMQQQLMQLQQALQQQMGMKTGVLQQQQSVGQRVGSHHSQLKSGICSPLLHQALSPQLKEKGKVEGDVTLPMEFEPYTSTVEDSSAQMGNANGADWQEGVYQKIKSMREMYVSELNDLYQKIASGMQQAQNKYTLQTPLMGSGPQEMASDGLGYVGKVLVLLLLALIGWVLVLKDEFWY